MLYYIYICNIYTCIPILPTVPGLGWGVKYNWGMKSSTKVRTGHCGEMWGAQVLKIILETLMMNFEPMNPPLRWLLLLCCGLAGCLLLLVVLAGCAALVLLRLAGAACCAGWLLCCCSLLPTLTAGCLLALLASAGWLAGFWGIRKSAQNSS